MMEEVTVAGAVTRREDDVMAVAGAIKIDVSEDIEHGGILL